MRQYILFAKSKTTFKSDPTPSIIKRTPYKAEFYISNRMLDLLTFFTTERSTYHWVSTCLLPKATSTSSPFPFQLKPNVEHTFEFQHVYYRMWHQPRHHSLFNWNLQHNLFTALQFRCVATILRLGFLLGWQIYRLKGLASAPLNRKMLNINEQYGSYYGYIILIKAISEKQKNHSSNNTTTTMTMTTHRYCLQLRTNRDWQATVLLVPSSVDL